MTTLRLVPFAFALVFAAASAAAAQEPPATAAAPAVAQSAQGDCAKPMARHDHGAERGMPTPKAAAPCGPAKTKTKAKVATGHDHAKFHKNQ